MGQNWKPRGPEIQMYSLYWDLRCHFTVNHPILPVSKFDPYPFLKWEYDMEYEWNIQLTEEIWFLWMGWSVRNQSNPLIGFNSLKCMFFPPARWGSLDFSKGAIPLLLPTLLPAPPSPRVLFQLVVTLPPMDPSHITSSGCSGARMHRTLSQAADAVETPFKNTWQCVKTNSTPVVHIKIAGIYGCSSH